MTSAKTFLGLSAAALAFCSGTAMAEDLIYQPVNPGFGGNPDIFNYLLNTAQIQNQYLPSSGGGGNGGGAPDITFPPIVIDLGGVGNPADTPATVGGTGAN
jgi:hypothetical protein